MVHPYEKNTSVYNFFFHPLHQPKVKKLAIITFVALSILTGLLWQIPFWIVNRLDDRKVTEWKRQPDYHFQPERRNQSKSNEDLLTTLSDADSKSSSVKMRPLKDGCFPVVELDVGTTDKPSIRDPNKSYVYDQATAGKPLDDKLILSYHSYSAEDIDGMEVFKEKRLNTAAHAGPFTFPKSKNDVEHWTADFADNKLLGFCKGGLLAQEELICAEHPSLVHLYEHIQENPELGYLQRDSAPDRIALIRGAKRRAVLKMYGNGFQHANRETIDRNLVILSDPFESNIFAFAAPPAPFGRGDMSYTREDMQKIYNRSFNAFHSIKQGAEERGKTPVVHSGNWGCGAFGGNPQITGLLQMLAASAAGIEHFRFYSMSSYGEFQEALGLFEKLKTEMPDATTSQVLAHLAENYDFRWGESNGT